MVVSGFLCPYPKKVKRSVRKTTNKTEACVFGAWAAAELGWRDDGVGERFSNGDLRVVAKRPIDVD